MLKSRSNHRPIGISLNLNLVRSYLREAAFIPFLSALDSFRYSNADDWPAVRIVTQIRKR